MGEICISHEYLILLKANYLHIRPRQGMCVIFFSVVFQNKADNVFPSCGALEVA